ncbi:DUF1194 domain-containing protein [Oricola thermophila]|uniref:DUF1194 domain-containing protein n=1 Tax=Oricola thermophila TaxID=2742145 RepID=A0A6N1V8S6_9HYPH|nr:DUF1194 domain-containing protein [Oricola thermophila]QKV17340.1 DUF1194 domain-containing protein [Oricola thermophila]
MGNAGYFKPVVGFLFLVLAHAVPARAEERVDVALVLAVDVSRSMSYEELRIQREGYASAIASPEVVRAIRQGAYRRIAVTLFEWANDSHSREVVGWTIIESQADANRIAAQLLATRSVGQRRTSISGAISHASRLLQAAPLEADRKVIDISGDGPNNQGMPVTVARDQAVAMGYTINGLPMMTRGGMASQFHIEDLDRYYAKCVIGGPGAFMVPVNDWDQFAEAVRRKLVLEIGDAAPVRRPAPVKAQFVLEDTFDCLIGEKIWQMRGWQFDDPNP